MKLSILLAVVVMMGGCASSYTAKREPNSPAPRWVEATKYQSYGHWECPAGWNANASPMTDDVFCESDAAYAQRMERYERSLTPRGASPNQRSEGK